MYNGCRGYGTTAIYQKIQKYLFYVLMYVICILYIYYSIEIEFKTFFDCVIIVL